MGLSFCFYVLSLKCLSVRIVPAKIPSTKQKWRRSLQTFRSAQLPSNARGVIDGLSKTMHAVIFLHVGLQKTASLSWARGVASLGAGHAGKSIVDNTWTLRRVGAHKMQGIPTPPSAAATKRTFRQMRIAAGGTARTAHGGGDIWMGTRKNVKHKTGWTRE